jgi:hypothetical protein
MAFDLSVLPEAMTQWGIYSFLLPFLLIFAVTYGLLIRSGVLGAADKGGKGPSGIVALVLAFFVTAYSGIGVYFTSLSGIYGMAITALLVVVLFVAMIGFDPTKGDGAYSIFKNSWLLGGIVIAAVFVALTLSGASFGNIAISNDLLAAVFVLFIVVAAIWFVISQK